MNFEDYWASNKAKDWTKKKAMSYWKQTAGHSAQHKDEGDFEVADPASVKWFQKEYEPTMKYLRGPLGKAEDLRLIGDLEGFHSLRDKIVRPLKKAMRWDFNGQERPLIEAGQIPPPRMATAWNPHAQGRYKNVTRRGCNRGVLGLACDHPVGSSECNGGVQVLRRIGENY